MSDPSNDLDEANNEAADVGQVSTEDVVMKRKEDDSNRPNEQVEVTTDDSKKASLLSSILFLTGSIIGTGIFMTPNEIVSSIPSIFFSLLLWVVCGLIALGCGLCYAELGALLPSCGGEYTYFLKAYHEIVGFSFMFTNFLFIKPVSVAILILFFVENLVGTFVSESTFENLYWAIRCMSVATMLFLCCLNCLSTYLSIKANDVLTYSKFVCLTILIGLGVYKLCSGKVDNVKDWGFKVSINASDVSRAVYNGMWAYDGFNQLAYMVEDMKNPEKNLLSASVIGLGLVIGFYLVVNLSYIALLGIDALKVAKNVAVTASQEYLKKGTAFIGVLVSLSALGSGNATYFCGVRILVDASRNRHLPKFVASVNRRFKTPLNSLVIQAVLSSVFLLTTKDIGQLLIYFSGASWVFYGMASAAVVVLRRKLPDVPRKFKVNIVLPIVLTIVSFITVVLGFINDWVDSLISVSIVIISVPVYFLFVHREGVVFQKVKVAATNVISRTKGEKGINFSKKCIGSETTLK